jgi:hypothetical protein
LTPRTRQLVLLVAGAAIVGCSDSTGPGSSLTLSPMYHLKLIDGTAVPFVSADGEFTDSGRVRRLGGDTVLVDLYRHTPGTNGQPSTGVVNLGTWRATQSGTLVILAPLIAFAFDTATVMGDTLTLRAHDGSLVHTDVYVAP